jgi:hypothetical protein
MPKPGTQRKPLKLGSRQHELVKKMRADGCTIGVIANNLSLPQDKIRRIIYGEDYKDKIRLFPSGNRPATTAAQPTQQLFLRWLSEGVERMAALPAWPMGSDQSTYFKSMACWDWSGARIQTVDLREFGDEAAHRRGDQEAIFRFAKDNRDALRHSWVIDQLEEWRFEGTKAAKKNIKRFCTAYQDDCVKRSPAHILENIRRDQRLYRDSLSPEFRNHKDTLHSALAAEHGIGVNTVKTILKKYAKAYKWWSQLKEARLYCQGHLSSPSSDRT